MPAKGTQFAVYKITKRRDEDITAALRRLPPEARQGRHGGAIRIAYRRHGGDAEAGVGGRGGAARQAVDRGRRSRRRWQLRRGFPAADRHAGLGRIPGAGGAQSAAALLRRDQRHQGADRRCSHGTRRRDEQARHSQSEGAKRSPAASPPTSAHDSAPQACQRARPTTSTTCRNRPARCMAASASPTAAHAHHHQHGPRRRCAPPPASSTC